MKRLFLMAALLVLGGALAWAQTTGTGSNSTSGNNQSPATSAQSQSSGSNPGTAATGSAADTTQQGTSGANASDQGAASTSSKKGSKAGRLPQTASPLPFLGMLGFGSMAAGMMVRKLRK